MCVVGQRKHNRFKTKHANSPLRCDRSGLSPPVCILQAKCDRSLAWLGFEIAMADVAVCTESAAQISRAGFKCNPKGGSAPLVLRPPNSLFGWCFV